MTNTISQINAVYTGYFTKNIKSYEETGKKINEKEQSIFEKMLQKEKINIPRVSKSQKSKKFNEYPFSENKIDIKI